MKYDYIEEMRDDIHNYIADNYTDAAIREKLAEREAFEEELHDDLWITDSVTGNASGSYTFNRYRAEEYIAHNLHLLKDALEEFCDDYANALERGAEYCDVTIRCYLLNRAITLVLNDLESEYEEV